MSLARLARFPEMKAILREIHRAANEGEPDSMFWAGVQDTMHEMTDAELTVVENEIHGWTTKQREDYACGLDDDLNESDGIATEKTHRILMVLSGF